MPPEPLPLRTCDAVRLVTAVGGSMLMSTLTSGPVIAPRSMPLEPIGKSQTMRVLREQVERVAGHDTPVMLLGESGAGREAFARYLHACSAQANGPFVTVVCAALTEQDKTALVVVAVALLVGIDKGDVIGAGFACFDHRVERFDGWADPQVDLVGQAILLPVLLPD